MWHAITERTRHSFCRLVFLLFCLITFWFQISPWDYGHFIRRERGGVRHTQHSHTYIVSSVHTNTFIYVHTVSWISLILVNMFTTRIFLFFQWSQLHVKAFSAIVIKIGIIILFGWNVFALIVGISLQGFNMHVLMFLSLFVAGYKPLRPVYSELTSHKFQFNKKG